MDRIQKHLLQSLAGNATGDGGSSSLMDSIPAALLDSFIPGFGVVSRIFSTYFGIDLSRIVTAFFVLAALLTAVRQARRIVWYFIQDYFTASITMVNHDDLYDNVMSWISENVVTVKARDLTATTKHDYPWNARSLMTPTTNSITTKTGTKSSVFNFKDFDARFPPDFKPAHGSHRFWYNNRVFWLNRDRRVTTSRWSGNPSEEETITLTTLGRSTAPIKRLMDVCKAHAAAKERESTKVRYPETSRGNYWRSGGLRPTRPFDTIYLEEHIKMELLEDLQEFLQPSAWRFYSRRGIPYRRGYLFYGQPGTGKTSFSLAIAGMFGVSLYVLSLADPSLTDQSLNSLFAGLPSSCIVLMEDIDTVAISRKADPTKSEEEAAAKKKKEEEEEAAAAKAANKDEAANKTDDKFNKRNAKVGVQSVTLSGLLNAIDGVASQEGRILIMTTNAPEALDPALIRPGRVDLQVYFGFLTKSCAKDMFLTMFGDDEQLLSVQEIKELLAPGDAATTKPALQNGSSVETNHAAKLQHDTKTAKLAEQAEAFAELLPEGSLTPAEVQGFLLRRRRTPQRAVDELTAWVAETLAAKAKGLNVTKQIEEAKEPAAHKEATGKPMVNGIHKTVKK